MYYIVGFNSNNEVVTYSPYQASQLIFILNDIKNNRVDINTIFIYELDKDTHKLELRLTLDMK